MKYYLDMRKKEILPLMTTKMGQKGIALSETDRERQILSFTYIRN